MARVAQLTQKTNQFNLTTRRYSEGRSTALADAAWRTVRGTHAGSLRRQRDRWCPACTPVGDALDVDTFLMSCRVIGRTIETAMLAHLCDHAKHGI